MARTLKHNANAGKHMWQAVNNRDVIWVTALVRQGGTVDLRNDDGLTPLMLAVQSRDMRMVKCLLEQQADPNLREPRDSMTAMHYALLRDSHDKINAEIVGLLKASKASMFIRNRFGYTAMGWSRKVRKKAPATMPYAFRSVCIDGDLPAVQLFLQDGTFIDARDDFGKTALILAAESGHTEVCRTILHAKADPNMQEANSQRNTALHYAYMSNNVALQELLIHKYGADTQISNAMGCNCVSAGRRAIAARRQRHRSHARASAGVSADIERKRKPYCRELAEQVLLGNFAEVTKILLSSTEIDPVYINGQNASGNTVLMEAVEQGMLYMANHLLTKCKADPNITNNRTETALHIAYEGDWTAIIEMLKLNGAQETIRNSIGFTPSEIPNRQRGNELTRDNEQKAKRLAATPRYTDPRLLQAVESHDLKEIERLIKIKQVNPNLVSKRTGDTALIHAAKRDSHEVCQLLLSLRADVNIRNRRGNTALHIAFANFNEELQSVLLKAEADATLHNKFGETPHGLKRLLTHLPGGRPATSYAPPTSSWANRKPQDESDLEALAAKFRQPMSPLLASLVEIGDVNAVQDFFSKKDNVDVNACNRQGNTALMHAVIHNQVDIIKYLVQEEGADINVQNRHGNTALHLGHKYGDHAAMMHALLELKADPSLANNLGASPMQLYDRFMRRESENSSTDWDANSEFREFMEKRNFVAKFAALLLREPVDITVTSPTNKTLKSRTGRKQTKAVGDDVQAQLIAMIGERYRQAPGDTAEAKQPYMQVFGVCARA